MSDEVWCDLVAGAERCAIAGRTVMQEHHPSVAVLSCSDARVPPSVVFDQPAGELFVVRIAGNTASPTAIASLEYAVAHLGVGLIVVLGHTHCGAVGAAADGVCSGVLSPVVGPICDLVRDHPEATRTELEAMNVARTVEVLKQAGGAITAEHLDGRLSIKGAVFDLDSGELRPVSPPNPQPIKLTPTPQPLESS
jgi:carbonic anhydrase